MAHERFEFVPIDPPAALAPLPAFHEEPTAVFGLLPRADESYVMIQLTGPVDPNECEELGTEAIEVTVLWGTNVLEVFHLSPPRPFVIGSEQGADVDFLLPPELAGFGRTAIVDAIGGAHRVVVPPGASLKARGRADAAPDGVLSAGKVFDLELGTLAFRVSTVTAGKRLPRAIGVDAHGISTALLCSFGATAAFLGVLAYYTPALGAMNDNDLDRDQAARLRPYLNALAEREEKRREEQGPSTSTDGGGPPGTAAQGPSGAMGRPDRPAAPKRTAIAGKGEVVLSRHQAMVEASTFGMVGMLSAMNARSLPTAVWGADVPNGPDASDAWGAMFGEEIGESGGAGGLGLIGPGEGGGGRGLAIAMGDIGTCGINCGRGLGGEGFGKGVGLAGGAHRPKGPVLRAVGETVLGGHLAPELIQRVVRQNFGRFRHCYETGLRGNPNLTGRVTTRFIIDREGAVTSASNGGSDLPDSKVVGCVVSAFYGVSFPAPKDGVVSVSYPIMFSPG